MNKTLLSILVVVYAGLFLFLRPWEIFNRNPTPIDMVYSIGAIVTLLGLIAACVLMISRKAHKLARALFVVFNVTYMLIGITAVVVYWSVWFFHTPTLTDRVRVAAMPFLIGVLMPVALVVYAVVHKEKG